MKLVKLREWMGATFAEGSAPDPRTVKKMIREGGIPGCLIGNSYFVDDDEFQYQITNCHTVQQPDVKLLNFTLDI